MEDANLNETIAEHTEGADARSLDRTRWWFASAAFPMIAGTLGPVASAFSVNALVNPWRQHIPPGSDITKAVFIHDPAWLLAVNAIQLAIAVIANFFLLLNMTKRIRFSIAQPITIVGWYISSILLIALTATASGPLLVQPEIEYVWSQAFYYGMFAAILYFIVASLMVVTVWGAEAGHYPKEFELTMSQRTLMLQTILFLTYLLLGALVFSHVEGWLYLDAVYWADVTLFTVGFGDMTLQTPLGRGLLIPYALIGIITLGLVIGSIRSLMLDRGKSKLDARILEKRRRRFVRRLSESSKGKALEPIPESGKDHYLEPKTHIPSQQSPQAELKRRHEEFYLMRKIQYDAQRRRRWTAMGVSTSTWAVLWLVGAKIFQICEAPYQNWSYFDGVYFSFQAMTTIGYGDIPPVSNSAKAFFVFWSFLALPTLTILISNAGDTVVKGIRDATVLLGNITILPGERGFKMDVKHFLSRLSFGVIFAEETIRESPPGFLGAAQPHSDTEEEDREDEENDGGSIVQKSGSSNRRGNDEEKAHRKSKASRNIPLSESSNAHKRKRALQKSKSREMGWKLERQKTEPSKWQGVLNELPKTRAEYCLVLIDEIRLVSQHLQHEPPRKYTYQEWAWYLRLMGEDESDPSTHRKPLRRPQTAYDEKYPQRPGGHGDKVNEKPKWSWVGHRSPLMDTRDEAQWILDKLSQKLREELQTAVKENTTQIHPEAI